MKKIFFNGVTIALGVAISLLILTGCTSTTVNTVAYNKSWFDANYTFTKCRTWIGDEVLEIEIEEWTDYEDGDQLQIKGKDGNVYLVSANNSILINEKGN